MKYICYVTVGVWLVDSGFVLVAIASSCVLLSWTQLKTHTNAFATVIKLIVMLHYMEPFIFVYAVHVSRIR